MRKREAHCSFSAVRGVDGAGPRPRNATPSGWDNSRESVCVSERHESRSDPFGLGPACFGEPPGRVGNIHGRVSCCGRAQWRIIREACRYAGSLRNPRKNQTVRRGMSDAQKLPYQTGLPDRRGAESRDAECRGEAFRHPSCGDYI